MKTRQSHTFSGFSRLTVIILIIIILIGLLGYMAYTNGSSSLTNLIPFSSINQSEVLSVLEKEMKLPETTATFVRVSDHEDYDEEEVDPFFQGAEKHYIVISYEGLDILYNPDDKQIIRSRSYITPEAQAAQQAAAESQAAANEVIPTQVQADNDTVVSEVVDTDNEEATVYSIEILNGTTVSGAAQTLADQLSNLDQYEVESVSNAVNAGNYNQSVIYSSLDEDLSELEEIVGATITRTLPEGEQISGDILIIVGDDQ